MDVPSLQSRIILLVEIASDFEGDKRTLHAAPPSQTSGKNHLSWPAIKAYILEHLLVNVLNFKINQLRP